MSGDYIDVGRLARALDIDWTNFWRDTPIEEPDGVHSHFAEMDKRAFAAAVAAEYLRLAESGE